MPIEMLWNSSLVINSVDLSANVRSLTVTRNSEDLDATAMGSTARTHYPGLRDDSMEVEFFQNYTAAQVEATIGPLLGNGTGVSIVAKPAAGATAVTNPAYTMTGFPLTHTPINGTVGEMNMTSVTLVPAAGSSIVKTTA